MVLLPQLNHSILVVMMSDQFSTNMRVKNGAMKVAESQQRKGNNNSAISAFHDFFGISKSSKAGTTKFPALLELQRKMAAQKEQVKKQSLDEKVTEALKLQLQGVNAKIMTTTNVRAKLTEGKESLLKEMHLESKQFSSKRRKVKADAHEAKDALKFHHNEYNVYRKLYNALKHPDDDPAKPVSEKVGVTIGEGFSKALASSNGDNGISSASDMTYRNATIQHSMAMFE